jgi:hypothetical protein
LRSISDMRTLRADVTVLPLISWGRAVVGKEGS